MGKYEITTGMQHSKPVRMLVYGPEGIGKTTFAAQLLKLKNGRLIDTEDGSGRVDVSRYPVPKDWRQLLDMIEDAVADPDCGAIGIDTLDAAERLCAADLCEHQGWDSLESPGYGAGYKRNWEQYGQLLQALDKAITAGKDVVMTAHAAMRKFEQPDQMGSYDRWELKLQNSPKANIAALCKEWADLVLFANYQTVVVTAPDGKTKKAAGGKRVMYTSHHPCWDAKNRFGMPEEMNFDFDEISSIFVENPQKPAPNAQKNTTSEPEQPKAQTSKPRKPKAQVTVEPVQQPAPAPDPEPAKQEPYEKIVYFVTPEAVAGLPDELAQLMMRDHILPIEIQTWTAKEGYYPLTVALANYDPDYLTQYLPSVWDSRIVPECKAARDGELPF